MKNDVRHFLNTNQTRQQECILFTLNIYSILDVHTVQTIHDLGQGKAI